MNKQRKVLVTVTYSELGAIIDTKTEEVQLATDTVSRQAAIDVLDVLCQEHRYKIPGKAETYSQYNEAWQDALDRAENAIGNLPSAQPTLYGYKIELLAYIARVMEKEGITAEQAVNSFDDLCMAVRLITEEAQQKVEEAVMK